MKCDNCRYKKMCYRRYNPIGDKYSHTDNCEHYEKYEPRPHEDLLVWHYCAEELPKENGLYFVTWMHNDSCYICLKEFADGRWKSILNIIAWMPCPKPCTKRGDKG